MNSARSRNNPPILISVWQFVGVILRAVQDAEDNYFLTHHAEKDFIGKLMGEHASKPAIVNREAFRVGFKPQESFGVVGEKFITKTGALCFIPVVSVLKVGLGFGPDGDRPLHLREVRIWLKTLRHGSPGLGSRSNSANASSSACRSAGVGEPPSSKSAS